jgi:Methyltransferase domain
LTVSRLDVVQSCLDLFESPKYLEIGVWKAKTFGPAVAGHKVAVDPDFPEGVVDRMLQQPNAEMHEVTSDKYFGTLDKTTKFDVIYLDGLHTFEQTLRDLLNSVMFIHDHSLIVIDDVYPDTYHGSLANMHHARLLRRAHGIETTNWMGDVYKLVFFIDSFMQQFRYRMVSDNHGQLILWKNVRPSVTERQVEAVARTPYEQLFVDEAALRRADLADIIAEIKADFAAAPSPA